eukprot:1581545-Pleurochrysis_carterae.AAC.1
MLISPCSHSREKSVTTPRNLFTAAGFTLFAGASGKTRVSSNTVNASCPDAPAKSGSATGKSSK